VDAVAKKDVIEEAAEWALSHSPTPISKREVPKTNRCGAPDPGLMNRRKWWTYHEKWRFMNMINMKN
jgi:hypothetical protein